jgi:hypothetical protein
MVGASAHLDRENPRRIEETHTLTYRVLASDAAPLSLERESRERQGLMLEGRVRVSVASGERQTA